MLDYQRQRPTPLEDTEQRFAAYKQWILSNIAAWDAALEDATEELREYVRARKEAGIPDPPQRPKSDVQFDYDNEHESGWGVK